MRYKVKSRIAAVLGAALLIGSFGGGFAVRAEEGADVTAEEETTVELGADTIRKAGVLEALGIISSAEEFAVKEGVTRREAAVAMVKLYGTDEAQLNESNPKVYFTDVDDSDEAAAYIKTASELGIISGNGDHTFSPDAYVTYAQLAKMAVTVLGYDVQAQLTGGYPTGYVAMASKRGLAKAKADTVIDGEFAIAFLYSMLDAETAYITGIGEDVTYGTDTDRTLLTERLDTYTAKGVVTENSETGLYGESTVSDGEIALDGRVFVYDGDTDEILGKYVRLYYKQERGSELREVLYAEHSDNNRTLTIDADDASFSGSTFTYYNENDKQKEARLTAGAALLFNGRAISDTDFDMKRLVPDEGTIILTDNNNDGVYEVVNVRSYVNVIVDGVSTYDEVIRDKYVSERTVVLKDGSTSRDRRIFDAANGKALTLDKIAEWDVLSVMESDDNSFYILRSSKTLNGEVDKVRDSGKKLVIDGVEYRTSYSYRASGEKLPEIGTNGTFLIDAYGKIAGMKSERGDWRVGLLTKIGEQSGTMDAAPIAKIYTTLGEEKKFDFATKVEVDGTKLNVSDKAQDGTSAIVKAILNGTEGYADKLAQALPQAQVIRYTTNSDGKINKVDTAYLNSEKEDAEQTLRHSYKYTGSQLYYKYAGKNFGGKETVTESTITFVVSLPLTGDVEMDYKASSGTYFGDNTYYHIESLMYTKDKIDADVVICYKDSSSTTITNNAVNMLVDDVGTTVGRDETEKVRVSGYYNGKYADYAISSTAQIDFDIEQGDMIRFDTNSAGEASVIQHVYSAKDNKFTMTSEYHADDSYNRNNYEWSNGSGDFSEGTRFIHGLLYHTYGTQMIISKTDSLASVADSSVQNKLSFSGAYVYVYDKSDTKNPVRVGSAADLQPYTKYSKNPSEIIIKTSSSVANVILIIK